MNTGILLNELYRSRRSLVIAAVLNASLIGLFAGMSYLVTDSAIVDLLRSYPQALLKAFNVYPDMFGTFEGWMSGEPYVVYVLILCTVAAMMAASTIAKELDQHTSESVFTLPISRRAVFLSKAVSHLLQITINSVLTAVVAVVVGMITADVAYPGRVVSMIFLGYLMALAFSGVGYAITAFLDSERSAMSIAAGAVLVSFAVNAIGAMGGSIGWLQELSLFHLLDAAVIARGDGLPLVGIAVSMALYLGGLLFGVSMFRRRDIAS